MADSKRIVEDLINSWNVSYMYSLTSGEKKERQNGSGYQVRILEHICSVIELVNRL